MTDLSPQAQAVLDAFTEDNSLHDWKHNHYNTDALAAALRALSYQCLHETPKGVHGHHARRYMLAGELRAIASELEKTND